jgi:hypothetical protein
VPLVAPQVNVTLLDINDNHPIWKDAPYYINLVEMTPPDSDVTTVGGREAEGGSGTARQPFPPWSLWPAPWDSWTWCFTQPEL